MIEFNIKKIKRGKNMKTTLLCTVGASLFEGNLKKLNENFENKPEYWKEIKDSFEKKQWDKLSELFQSINPSERFCGAEINTIEEIRKKRWLTLENIVFFVSDTEDGKNTGKFLQLYYENRKDLNLKNVEVEIIELLQDKDPKKFKKEGLRNLVKKLGKMIKKYGSEYIAIDATGGYKAQIAVAVILGQTLNIPVFYKHEKFNEIIDFPPLPISLDYDILGKNADLLSLLEREDTIDNINEIVLDEKLKVFIDTIDTKEGRLYSLNTLGTIYLESFRIRYPKAPNLISLNDDERKEPTFSEHHYPKGLEDFVYKIWKKNKWIKTCYSMPYYGQAAIKGIYFKVDTDKKILIGIYKKGDDFGGRFGIEISDNNSVNLNWAADYLNREYGNE
ncbi:MAG: putative CRISPR-associated protein [candidate division WOR-3 bacterium]